MRQNHSEAAREKGYQLKQITFENAAGENKTITVTTDDKGRKIILIQPSETDLYRSALSEKVTAGYTMVIGHSNGETVNGLNWQQVSTVIQGSNAWTAGQPIIMDACFAGLPISGVASQVAKNLGFFVTAPTDRTWVYPWYIGGGTVGTGSYPELSPGSYFPKVNQQAPWRTFSPAGVAVSQTASAPGH